MHFNQVNSLLKSKQVASRSTTVCKDKETVNLDLTQ